LYQIKPIFIFIFIFSPPLQSIIWRAQETLSQEGGGEEEGGGDGDGDEMR